MTVTPKRSLGQHFLVDVNLLGVIGRQAALQENDVVRLLVRVEDTSSVERILTRAPEVS